MPNHPQEFGSIDLDFSSNPELAAEFPDSSKALLMLGFELLHAKMWPIASISEQLQAYLNQGFDPAEAVGELDLVTDTFPFWKLEKNWYKLDREDAARLYLYRSLTASKDYAIEEELKDGVAEHLGLNDTVLQNTIERISEEVEKQLGGEVRTEVRKVLKELEDNDEVVTLPESSADGREEPPLVLISREMRKRAY